MTDTPQRDTIDLGARSSESLSQDERFEDLVDFTAIVADLVPKTDRPFAKELLVALRERALYAGYHSGNEAGFAVGSGASYDAATSAAAKAGIERGVQIGFEKGQASAPHRPERGLIQRDASGKPIGTLRIPISTEEAEALATRIEHDEAVRQAAKS